MSSTAPHSLMELSLLLSALMKYGVEPKSFQRISTEFVQDESITENPTYDAARFTPDLLQNLYLRVLKDEVRSASQCAAQRARRKRSPTPPLRSLDEAGKHKHLLPGLARRYYDQYVEQIAAEIAKDEEAYEELVKEVELLEIQQQNEEAAETITNAARIEAGAAMVKPANGVTPESPATVSSQTPRTASPSSIVSKPPVGDSIKAISALPERLQTSTPVSLVQRPASLQNLPSTPASATRTLAPSNPLDMVSQATTTPVPSQVRGSSQSQTGTPQPVPSRPRSSSGLLPNVNTLGSFATPDLPNVNLGPLESTPVAQPNRRPLPATFTPLPGQLSGPFTPSGSFSFRRQFPGLTPIDTSKSSTKWKDPGRGQVREGRSPPRPTNSPYLSESPSPEPESRTESRLQSAEIHQDTPSRGRAGRGRATIRGRGRGGRISAVSPGPSTSNTRIRSQSAVSGAEESTVETTTRSLKTEPPATPGLPDEAPSFASTPAETKPGTRRRDQLRDGETPKPNLKRKRTDTTEETPEVSLQHKFFRPGQILASRNFTRITSALLNDINSHKLASVFAKPITEKSAPGYQSLIYRPQDLKSIRGAISAGSRYIATIPDPNSQTQDSANGGDTPSTGTTKATNIWVESTPEVIPPRGIVNSAQLEKELCRMLANAVMYNPDPKRGFGPTFRFSENGGYPVEGEDEEQDHDDGALVSDAREMFESVDQAVSAWRAAERVNSGDLGFRGGGGGSGDMGKRDESEEVFDTEDDGEKSARRKTRG